VPKRLPLHVEQWRDRHGRLRTYFRKAKGRRTSLPNDLKSSEFEAAYAAAFSGSGIIPKSNRLPPQRDTIEGLITSYLTSPEYIDLRQTTKKGYSSRLEALRVQHGKRTVSGMTREGINTKILAPYADRPGARLSILKMLRVLIRHAVDIGWLMHDPSLGIKRPKMQEIRSWTDAEISTFEERWPIGTKQRVAFALFLFTGQRVSDIHRMTWADVIGPRINVVQQKTGAKLAIKLHAELRHALDETPRQHVTILNTVFGKPFSVKGFGQWMRTAITAAGLPLECQPHGLRKAAGRRLAEAGCTAKQIMSVLGHKTLAEAERYTRDADQPHLADAGITLLEAQIPNIFPKPASGGLGKLRNKK
jgi:enterobacteria phage integrase